MTGRPGAAPRFALPYLGRRLGALRRLCSPPASAALLRSPGCTAVHHVHRTAAVQQYSTVQHVQHVHQNRSVRMRRQPYSSRTAPYSTVQHRTAAVQHCTAAVQHRTAAVQQPYNTVQQSYSSRTARTAAGTCVLYITLVQQYSRYTVHQSYSTVQLYSRTARAQNSS